MSEQYLPVRESLGYQQLKEALWEVFKVDLDKIMICHSGCEDFFFLYKYKEYEMRLGISSTMKNMQLETGEGGILTIRFPSPEYPRDSSFNWRSFPYLFGRFGVKRRCKICVWEKEGKN